MAHSKLFLASIVVVLAMSASSVAAATCPAQQVFTGRLPIGSDLVVTYTLPVDSQRVYVTFYPEMCNLPAWYILYANGNSVASDCGVAAGLPGVAGTYTATVNSHFYGEENTVPLKYTVTVLQKNC